MTTAITPLQQVGDFLLKRDDLFEVAGVRGGKARACWPMAEATPVLVAASQKRNPQGNIVAHVARELGVPCRVHAPTGRLSPELVAAQSAGAEIIQHPAGHSTVLASRARADAQTSGWRLIEFGMESDQAVQGMAAQARATVAHVNDQGFSVRRVVVSVGSGISLAGILQGFAQASFTVPVVGVVVRKGRIKRLEKRIDKWAPPNWRKHCQLVQSELDFDEAASVTRLGGVELDPLFEAKCLPFLRPDDLFWLVAIR